MKLLIIEDEVSLLETLKDYLSGESYLCEYASNFHLAGEKLALYDYDIVILDLTLPGGNGMDLLPLINKKNPVPGVIILTARNSLNDKIKGLDMGADDYLTKPFHLAELNSRIRALIRRNKLEGHNQLSINDITLNLTSKEVFVKEQKVVLNRKEFELLLFFVTNKNRALTRESIAEHIWGDSCDQLDNFDLIYAHIKNLRKKISAAGGRDNIETVYGFGYRMKSS